MKDWGLPLLLVGLVAFLPAAAAKGELPMRSPDLGQGESWTTVFTEPGEYQYYCHQHHMMIGSVIVQAAGPRSVDIGLRNDTFSPTSASVEAGGSVTWTNHDPQTHSVVFLGFEQLDSTWTELHPVLLGLLGAGALLSGILLVYALRAHWRTQERTMLFVAGAFGVFLAKNVLVAYSLHTGMIKHEALEFVDATGDLVAVGLLVMPLLQRGSD